MQLHFGRKLILSYCLLDFSEGCNYVYFDTSNFLYCILFCDTAKLITADKNENQACDTWELLVKSLQL